MNPFFLYISSESAQTLITCPHLDFVFETASEVSSIGEFGISSQILELMKKEFQDHYTLFWSFFCAIYLYFLNYKVS